MLKTFFPLVNLLLLTGCGPGYRWINDEYPVAELDDHFEMDKGNCLRESDYTYPDPWPAVQDPEEYYYECMANTTRLERYAVTNEDGTTEYRTVTRRGDPYQCTPTREHKRYYREYESVLRQQRNSRAKYVNSCLSIMGWQRIKIEENLD